MSVIGLDLNASRLRAVGADWLGHRWMDQPKVPLRLALERDRAELPVAISLAGRTPEVGTAGVKLTRLRPHATCTDFLPHLGSDRTWDHHAIKVNADEALGYVFATVAQTLGRVSGLVLCVPAYLCMAQVLAVRKVAEVASLPLVASLCVPVAALQAMRTIDASRSSTSTLVIDADGYALTWSLMHGPRRVPHGVRTSPTLGRASWLRRLIDGVAHRFIRHCRQDPRDSAHTEQSLYEQLIGWLALERMPSQLPWVLQNEGLTQQLLIASEDLIGFAGPCLQQASNELDALLAESPPPGIVSAILTAEAAALPGLPALVRSRFRTVHTLGPDAMAVAAYEIASSVLAGQSPQGHFDSLPPMRMTSTASLPEEGNPPSGLLPCFTPLRELTADTRQFPEESKSRDAFAERGSSLNAESSLTIPALNPSLTIPALNPLPSPLACLHFRGQDHLLSKPSFVLGRDPSCDLVFESQAFPHVSARHCEIVFDHRNYLVYDRSRYGTLLNDQPVDRQATLKDGDWIRLGPKGPLLRFLATATSAAPAQGADVPRSP
ncbi:MAG: FHA domain-containing protein [Planctomycetia bacterium]|nr:FHA domain-containing protein [Planctomycetia bacterium]